MLSVRTSSLYLAVRFAPPGTQPIVSDGSAAKASLVPSGLTAGYWPVAIVAALPPETGTDSISSWQPPWWVTK